MIVKMNANQEKIITRSCVHKTAISTAVCQLKVKSKTGQACKLNWKPAGSIAKLGGMKLDID